MASAALHFAVWSAVLAGVLRLVSDSSSPRGLALTVVLFFLFLSVKGMGGWLAGSFREIWTRASMEDLTALIRGTGLHAAILCLALLSLPALRTPPWLAVLDGAITIMVLATLRVLWQLSREGLVMVRPGRAVVLAGRRSFVELEMRRMRLRPTGDRIIGVVLQDPGMEGALLRRVPVLPLAGLERQLAERGAVAVVLVPPLRAAFNVAVEERCVAAGVHFQPTTSPYVLGELVEAAGEEFLARPPLRLDLRSLSSVVTGKRVLVTGGGGSIGSELGRQLFRLRPSALVLVDRSETALFQIEQELASRGGGPPVSIEIADVRDAGSISGCFQRHRPQIVFHAAAFKHVPMMERHPSEAILNNVMGTRVTADAAVGAGAEIFVFISTDKAVQPSSVMGATKRLGEIYIQSLSGRAATRFSAVRFGNVLGSSGSVVPIFIEQIKRGQAITVTHPEMTRYFMSIPEACQLVLEAAALATGGEVFVLDMGEPVKIVDLARRLIARAGLRPDEEVPIIFSGPRPGEKLHEQLVRSEERVTTAAPGIWRISAQAQPRGDLRRALDALAERARSGDDEAVLRLLGELVPDYERAGEPRGRRDGAAAAAGQRLPEQRRLLMAAPGRSAPARVDLAPLLLSAAGAAAVSAGALVATGFRPSLAVLLAAACVGALVAFLLGELLLAGPASPGGLFLLGLGFYHVVLPVEYLLDPALPQSLLHVYPSLREEHLGAPLLATALALAGFLLGYARRRPYGPVVAPAAASFDHRRAAWAAVALCLLGAALYLAMSYVATGSLLGVFSLNYRERDEVLYGLGALGFGINLLGAGGASLAILLLSRGGPGGARRTALALGLLLAMALLSFLVGSKMHIFQMGLATLVGSLAAARRLSLFRLTAMVVILLVPLSLINLARNRQGQGLAAMFAFVQEESDELDYNPGNNDAWGPYLTLLHTVNTVPVPEGLRFGSTYLQTVTLLPPRFLYPGRPTPLDEEFSQEFLGREYYDNAGFGFSGLAEAYLNFGHPGAFFIFFLAGLGLGALRDLLARRPGSLSGALLLGTAAPWLVLGLRTSASALSKGYLLFTLLPTLLILLAGRRGPSARRSAGAPAGGGAAPRWSPAP